MIDFNRIKNLLNPLNVIITGVIVLFICLRIISNNQENAYVIETIISSEVKNDQNDIKIQTSTAEQADLITEEVAVSEITKSQSNSTIATEALAYSVELGQTFTLDAFNMLSKEELMTFSGIGEVTAQAILDYRRDNGPFNQFADLLSVKGIGEKKLQKIMTILP